MIISHFLVELGTPHDESPFQSLPYRTWEPAIRSLNSLGSLEWGSHHWGFLWIPLTCAWQKWRDYIDTAWSDVFRMRFQVLGCVNQLFLPAFWCFFPQQELLPGVQQAEVTVNHEGVPWSTWGGPTASSIPLSASHQPTSAKAKHGISTIPGAYLGVSWNGGTPKSSISRWDFPWKKQSIWGYPHFRKPPIGFLLVKLG